METASPQHHAPAIIYHPLPDQQPESALQALTPPSFLLPLPHINFCHKPTINLISLRSNSYSPPQSKNQPSTLPPHQPNQARSLQLNPFPIHAIDIHLVPGSQTRQLIATHRQPLPSQHITLAKTPQKVLSPTTSPLLCISYSEISYSLILLIRKAESKVPIPTKQVTHSRAFAALGRPWIWGLFKA